MRGEQSPGGVVGSVRGAYPLLSEVPLLVLSLVELECELCVLLLSLGELGL